MTDTALEAIASSNDKTGSQISKMATSTKGSVNVVNALLHVYCVICAVLACARHSPITAKLYVFAARRRIIAFIAVSVIVSGLDGRAEMLLEHAKRFKNSKS